MRQRHHARAFVSIVAVFALGVPVALGADWSRWLGPDQNGRSPETGIFGETEPRLGVAWNRPLGKAYSAIAVAEGKAVTMFADGETDWLVAIDAANGEELWRYRIDDMFPKIGGADGGQLSMPVIERGVVYGLGARGQLFAVRMRDGSEIWSRRIDKELGAVQPHFGFTTSPLIVGKLLYLQTGGADGHSLTALAKKNGKLRWAAGDEPVGYQSPIVIELAGRKQIVAVTNESVAGHDPADGTRLWRAEHEIAERPGHSTPISIGDGAFVLTGRNESVAFRVSGDGDEPTVKELWRATTLKQNFAMPVVHDGYLYGYDADFLTCVDAATGERRWKSRSDAAGLILVDGHLVLYASDGNVVVAPASPTGFDERARVKVSERAGYTFPSFSDGGIFVRNLESIARVDVLNAER